MVLPVNGMNLYFTYEDPHGVEVPKYMFKRKS